MDKGKKGAATPLRCESALNKLKRKNPYGWDLNVYRGCCHGCCYCYAASSHRHLDSADFVGDIFVKTNIAEALERQLAAPGWKREVVNLGGVTDNYQSAEAHHALMPDLLRLLIKYRTPAIISTKSALALRDYDLIDQLSRVAWVNVAASVTTADETLRQKLEPGAAPVAKRLELLAEFAKTNATTGLHMMPVIPHLTDGADNFHALFAAAKAARVSYLLPGALYLRGASRGNFFAVIDREFPEQAALLKSLYKTGGAGKAYKEELYGRMNPICAQYNLCRSYTKPMKEKLAGLEAQERAEAPVQTSLFDPPPEPEN